MKTSISSFSNNEWTTHELSGLENQAAANLVLCFGEKKLLEEQHIYKKIKEKFPVAEIVFASTSGEIFHDAVQDHSLVTAAIQFEHTIIRSASVKIQEYKNSYDAAKELVKKLPTEELVYVLVISDGSMVNGSELVKGLNDGTGSEILVTGGLSGDAADFKSTLTGLNAEPSEGNVIAIGFYGKRIHVTHGTQGGWDMFGPERDVTRSESNVLFEIDGKSALELYKKYLGPDADHLPGSALLFPLSVIIPGSSEPVVRTILSIDEETQSMTFAGDIPLHSKVRFMKANFDKLTAAASSAAQHSFTNSDQKPQFSLLISCVGRKLILGPRIEEEVEAINELFGNHTLLAGFYSYGEISPFNEGVDCQLHNQTMTITSFYEL